MIYELIKKRQPFAFARYGDGEYNLIRGRSVRSNTQAGQQDEWTAPSELTELGIALKNTLNWVSPNYYYGIPMTEPLYTSYRELMPSNNILDANYFINESWDKYCEFDWGEHILISRENGTIESPPNCVYHWKLLLERLEPYVDYTDTLFVFSAGPMSCVAIDWLWKQNPNNMYVDVGSAADFKTKKRVTRPFMKAWPEIINGNSNSNT